MLNFISNCNLNVNSNDLDHVVELRIKADMKIQELRLKFKCIFGSYCLMLTFKIISYFSGLRLRI